MTVFSASGDRRFGQAWLIFAAAVALHVTDEATHGFLDVYNPNALAIRARFPFLPVPTFTMTQFIVALGTAVVLLLLLSTYAFRGRRWIRMFAIPVAIIPGVLNALLHSASSVYFHRWMPGVYSSPILFAASLYLLWRAWKRTPEARSAVAR